jgi:hypothetical protein
LVSRTLVELAAPPDSPRAARTAGGVQSPRGFDTYREVVEGETGKRENPSLPVLRRREEALGVSVTELLG